MNKSSRIKFRQTRDISLWNIITYSFCTSLNMPIKFMKYGINSMYCCGKNVYNISDSSQILNRTLSLMEFWTKDGLYWFSKVIEGSSCMVLFLSFVTITSWVFYNVAGKYTYAFNTVMLKPCTCMQKYICIIPPNEKQGFDLLMLIIYFNYI